MIRTTIGAVLVILGLAIGYLDWYVATMPVLVPYDRPTADRLTMLLTTAAAVSILSGVATLLISARRP